MKTVSIIMGAYNCPDFIVEAITSVLAQTIPEGWELEVLVGVDGCPRTLETVKTIQHPAVTIYEMDKNYGTYIVANTLIQQAKGEIIGRIDADDKVKPDRLSKILKIFETKPQIGMVNTYISTWRDGVIKEEGKSSPAGIWTFRREVLEKGGGYRPWRCSADSELASRLHFLGVRSYIIPEYLYIRRVHTESLTSSGDTRYGSQMRKKHRAFLLENVEKYKKGEKPEQITPEIGVVKNVFR